MNVPIDEECLKTAVENLFDNAADSQIINWLYQTCTLDVPLQPCCVESYNELCDVDEKLVCVQTVTDHKLWEKERQFRITGSRCYGIFTYKKADWKKKCSDYFCPKPFSNQYVRHGIVNEPVAFDIFKMENKVMWDVVKPGLVICRKQPWLAYSPDGIAYVGSKPKFLIEIKCPFKGKLIH